jgi:hypothetical protein
LFRQDTIRPARVCSALPVLRGFSRSVKQDSEASSASGGVSNANVSAWHSTVVALSPADSNKCKRIALYKNTINSDVAQSGEIGSAECRHIVCNKNSANHPDNAIASIEKKLYKGDFRC